MSKKKAKIHTVDLLHGVFKEILIQGTDEYFEQAGFGSHSEEYRAKFGLEFSFFQIWCVIYFIRHRKEFSKVSELDMKINRALVGAFKDVIEIDEQELEDLYNTAISRLEEMDADMNTKPKLHNLVVGLANRIFGMGKEDDSFFKCSELGTNYFAYIMERQSKMVGQIKIVS